MIKNITIIVAHPDDEIIFFAPLFNSVDSIFGKLFKFNSKVICLTCKSNSIRSTEFENIVKYLKCSSLHYDLPIIRGFAIGEFIKTYQLLRKSLKTDTDICVTHSLYGDDHFHPQHSLISIVCLFWCIKNRKSIIVHRSPKSIFNHIVVLLFKQTDFMSIKSILFLPIKILLIVLDFMIFKKIIKISADKNILEAAQKIYKSQSLEYHSFLKNEYSYAEIRYIWRLVFFIRK